MDVPVMDKLEDVLSAVEYNGGGITQLLDNTPVSIDGSTFISTSSTGTICEVTGKGVLFEALVSTNSIGGNISITFDGGVSLFKAQAGTPGYGGAGYVACDLYAGGSWLIGIDQTGFPSSWFNMELKDEEDFKAGFEPNANAYYNFCSSQHGLVFENGLKITCAGNINAAAVRYKLLD